MADTSDRLGKTPPGDGGAPLPPPPPPPPPPASGFPAVHGVDQEGATLITPGGAQAPGLADTRSRVVAPYPAGFAPPPYAAGVVADEALTVTPSKGLPGSGSRGAGSGRGRFGSSAGQGFAAGGHASSSGALPKLRSGELSEADLDLVRQAEGDPRRRLGDRYLLLRELGKGGMGVVWMALDNVLGRPVAVKRLLSNHGAGEEELERFLAEAQACAALRHSGIAAIYDVGEVDGSPFIAMEYVKGRPLHRLARDQEMKPREAARIVCEVSRAIDHAHENDVLHRDLKPHNILVEESGRAVVLDFGLARQVDRSEEDGGLTVSGAILGTPAYMAPEQANAEDQKIGPRSDVYGLGAVLYECLTGRPPHEGDSPLKVLAQLLLKDPVRPRVVRPSLSRDLETICVKAMEREIERRYETAGALADDLQRYLDDEPIHARPPGLGRRVSRFLKRQRVLVTAVVLVVAVAAVAGWKVYSVRRAAEEQRLAERRVADQRRTQRAAGLMARAQAERRPVEALSHIEASLEALTTADDGYEEAKALRDLIAQRVTTRQAAAATFAAIPGSVEGSARLALVNATLEIFPDFSPALAERVRIQARQAARDLELGLAGDANPLLGQSLEDVKEIAAIDPPGIAGLLALLPAVEGGILVVRHRADGEMGYRLEPLYENLEIWQSKSLAAVVDHLGTRLNVALEDRPGDPELLVARSRLRAASGQVSEALGDAIRALDGLVQEGTAALRLEALVARGRAQSLLGDMVGAAETLDEVIATAPQNLRSLIDLSTVLIALNRPVEALDRLGEALDLDDHNLVARLMRAKLREERQDLHGAADDLYDLFRDTDLSVFRAEAEILKAQARNLSYMPEGTHCLGYYYGHMKVGYSVIRYQFEEREGERSFVVTGESRYGAGGSGMAFDYRFEFDTKGDGPLRNLSFDLQIMGGRRRVRANAEGDVLIIDVQSERGEQHKRIDGALGLSVRSQYALEIMVRSGRAKPGDTGQTHIFSPVSTSIERVDFTLRSIEKKREKGRERLIYRFDVKSGNGPTAEIMLNDRGETLMSRAGGFFLQLPESEATVRRIEVSGFDRTLALHSMRLLVKGDLPKEPLAAMTILVSGVVKAPDDPGPGVRFNRQRRGVFQVHLERQSLSSADLAVQRPVAPPATGGSPQSESQSGPGVTGGRNRLMTGEEGLSVQREVVGLKAKVEEILAGERGAVESVRKICTWVLVHEKELGVRDEQDILILEAFGEDYTSNLKAVLQRSVDMCFAAGIPARSVVGYELNRLDRGVPEFIPLWWMEVWIGRWISIDPFLNHVPARNFRIACSRTGLDLMDLMGLAMANVKVLDYQLAGAPTAPEPAKKNLVPDGK